MGTTIHAHTHARTHYTYNSIPKDSGSPKDRQSHVTDLRQAVCVNVDPGKHCAGSRDPSHCSQSTHGFPLNCPTPEKQLLQSIKAYLQISIDKLQSSWKESPHGIKKYKDTYFLLRAALQAGEALTEAEKQRIVKKIK